jgi:hypothetical protein
MAGANPTAIGSVVPIWTAPTIPPAPVTSVFGRVGAVVAVLGDYSASLVTNDSTVAGATVADALNTLLAGQVTFGSPALLTVGNIAADGVSASAARADHVHKVDPMIPMTSFLGSALKYWWEVELALTGNPNVTVAGGNFTAIRDRVAGANLGVAAGNTTYTAFGGPGDNPFATPATTAAVMNAAVAVPAANRYAWYVVARARSFAAVANARIGCVAGVGLTGHVFVAGRANNADNYVTQVDFTGGTQGINIVTPANDFGYHVHSMLPLSTGAKYQIDGVDVAPNFTGNDTVVTCTLQAFGFSGSSGTDMLMIAIVDTTVGNFAANDAYMQARCRARFGVGRA